jgi:hypothetical protein
MITRGEWARRPPGRLNLWPFPRRPFIMTKQYYNLDRRHGFLVRSRASARWHSHCMRCWGVWCVRYQLGPSES